MTTTAAASGRVARRALWRNRDFMLLWSGQTVSTLGSQVSATAVPLLVLAMTGSPATAGLIGFLGGLPHLLAQLPAGVLVDRWDRWRIMIICDIGRLAAAASVPVAWWLGWLTIGQVAVVACVETTLYVLFHLAEGASLPRIVPPESLSAALAQNEAKVRGASLAGKPLGGLLFGVGHALPFAFDAISYALSTSALLLMRRRDLAEPRAEAPESMWRETLTGVRWLLRQPFLRAAVILVAGSNLIFQAVTLTVIVLAAERGASPAMIGVVLGCWGVGGLAGALLAPWLQPVTPPRAVVIGVNWVWAGLLPLLLAPQQPLSIGLVGAATAFIGPLWNVVVGTYFLTLTPNHLLGRVRSVSSLAAWGAIPFGALIGGLLLEAYGPVMTIWSLTGLMLALAVAASVSPAVRGAPRRTTSEPP